MTIEVKVPVLPESVEDATIATWHKQPGDAILRDENLVDLETDKVVLEVPAPADGVVRELRVRQGETVHSGDVLAVIEEGAVAAEPAAAEAGAGPADQTPPSLSGSPPHNPPRRPPSRRGPNRRTPSRRGSVRPRDAWRRKARSTRARSRVPAAAAA
jgi:2-oxoglutarate dehydrogenase E2 component (dihydrolipoamide succinyltransferase)